MITMVKIGNFFSFETAERKVEELKRLTGSTFYNFEFPICPAGGSLDVFVQSDYDFDGPDAEKELLSAFTYCLIANIEPTPAPAEPEPDPEAEALRQAGSFYATPTRVGTASVTEKELAVMNVIRETMDMYCDNFSDVMVEDIATVTKYSKATVKGVLGSLVKKDLVEFGDVNGEYNVYYLTDGGFEATGGVPEWRREA